MCILWRSLFVDTVHIECSVILQSPSEVEAHLDSYFVKFCASLKLTFVGGEIHSSLELLQLEYCLINYESNCFLAGGQVNKLYICHYC